MLKDGKTLKEITENQYWKKLNEFRLKILRRILKYPVSVNINLNNDKTKGNWDIRVS